MQVRVKFWVIRINAEQSKVISDSDYAGKTFTHNDDTSGIWRIRKRDAQTHFVVARKIFDYCGDGCVLCEMGINVI